MKILIADDLPTSAIDLLSKEGWTVDARSGRSAEQLTADIADADAIVVRSATKVTAALINAAPRLRAIARAGTGVDNVDVPAASARGIVVMNAPGASSISVAELTMGLLLSLARHMPGADAAMKQGKWEKKKFQGSELRGKTLGLVGLGRIGQEVARRAAAFEMRIIAFDPFLPPEVAADLDVTLVPLDDLFAQAEYVSLHMPSTPQTRNLVNAQRLAKARKGLRLVNTARGDLVDEAALADAIESGQVAGAALDVFIKEPTVDHRLQNLPQVVATPHIAASTVEAQELVGLETAMAVRDFLRDGVIRNAVNFPAIPDSEFARVRPFMVLAERMGSLLSQTAPGRMHGVSIRYYGPLVTAHADLLASAVVAGVLRPMLFESVTIVNARAVAADRGIEIVESRSSRVRHYANMLSVKLQTAGGERWIEGTVFEGSSPRLTLLDGVEIEAPLGGTLILIANNDQPGVIGEVGTILGRHGINIASFALGRSEGGAAAVVRIDADGGDRTRAIEALRGATAIKEVRLVTLEPVDV